MVISIRGLALFIFVCVHWTSVQGQDEAVGRLDSSKQPVASLETGAPERWENSRPDLTGGQGARGFEVGKDLVANPRPAGVSDLADDLVYRGRQTMMVAEYMYRL